MPFTISLDKKEMTFKINNSLKILLSNNSRDFQIFDGLKNYVRDSLCTYEMKWQLEPVSCIPKAYHKYFCLAYKLDHL